MSALETMIGRMTVGELARFLGRSVEDVVNAALARAQAATPRAETRPHVKPGKVARGGLRVDQVLGVLGGIRGPAKMEDVRVKVGGSAAQVRSALQRLAEAGKVKITGERRGTRYAVR
jgi:hypothetical protein